MDWQLAQMNIARFPKPADDPANADFMAALDRVNALAETSPGFVWRFTGDGNNALDLQPFDDPNAAINMSVRESVDALAAFVYRSMDHRGVMRRRREWFEEMSVYVTLGWVPAGARPTVAEAKERLALLEARGPSA